MEPVKYGDLRKGQYYRSTSDYFFFVGAATQGATPATMLVRIDELPTGDTSWFRGVLRQVDAADIRFRESSLCDRAACPVAHPDEEGLAKPVEPPATSQPTKKPARSREFWERYAGFKQSPECKW